MHFNGSKAELEQGYAFGLGSDCWSGGQRRRGLELVGDPDLQKKKIGGAL